MISIPVYNTLGKIVRYLDFDYNNDVKDITGRLISYPDRIYQNEVNDLVLTKAFFKTRGNVVVEQNWFDKVKLYRKINNLFLSKTEVLQAIEERLNSLIITGIKAKNHFESLASGDEAEQLFKITIFISTANNPLISRVVDTYSRRTKNDWKIAFRDKLLLLEEEAQKLLIRKKQLMNETLADNSGISNEINNLRKIEVAKQTIKDNNNKTFEIVILGFVILIVTKRLSRS
jgi:hypothetical protein